MAGPLPNCPIRDMVVTESDRARYSPTSAAPQQWLSRAAFSPGTPTVLAEGPCRRHQSPVLGRSVPIPVAACCLQKSRRALTENAELKHRLHLWEASEIHKLVGRVSTGQQTHGTSSQKEKGSCSLKLMNSRRGELSKAMKGFVG